MTATPARGPVRPVSPAAGFDAEIDTGVAIVGAGACGLVTALMLHDAGIECVVLERDPVPSGSTALSAGLIPAVRTRAQLALGIHDDTPERFAADIQEKAHGGAPADLLKAYVEAAGPALDALETRHGLAWTVIDEFLYPGHSRPRLHGVAQRTGTALMAGLQAAAEAAGIPVVTEAMVDELWFDDAGLAVGVGYRRPDGQQERVGCKALVLACNGFGGNADMVRELLPEMREATFGGHTGNDGSAILWGRQLGARLRDLGAYQGHGSWMVPQGALMSWAAIMEGGIQVNSAGSRFHDETQGYSEAAVHVLAQPGGIAWNVFDQPLLDLVRMFPEFCDAEALGAVRRCDTVADLATQVGCASDVLQATLDTMASTGPQPDGRRFTRSLGAPYFLVKVTGALFHTQGGLDVAPDMRVLREDGQAFPNLFAAGGAAGGVSGQAVWGYSAGNGLLSAVAGGYIAAETIARHQLA